MERERAFRQGPFQMGHPSNLCIVSTHPAPTPLTAFPFGFVKANFHPVVISMGTTPFAPSASTGPRRMRVRAVLAVAIALTPLIRVFGADTPIISFPVVISHPASATVIQGDTASFGVTVSGNPAPTYQWRKNGAALSGATLSTLTLPNVQFTDAGNYDAVVTNGAGAVNSASATLTVAASAPIDASPPASAYSFSNFAGQAGTAGFADGAGGAARLFGPAGIAVDTTGNLFVADFNSHTIRKISVSGVVTTLAGQGGSSGYVDATGSAARFAFPIGVAVDRSGNVFVAELGNPVIRKVTPDGVVTTFASGLGSLAGIAMDATGSIFVLAGATVRKVTPAGAVTLFAGGENTSGSADGTGAAARFKGPTGITTDGNGNLYVADTDNHTIRKISPAGVVTTLAGLAGTPGRTNGSGSGALFNRPRGIAVDNQGNVLVSDTDNQTIRKITASGSVSTIGGTVGIAGTADGTGGNARFSFPSGLAVDAGGDVFVADGNNQTVRLGVPPAAIRAGGRLANLSTRGFVPAGGDLIVGFAILGGPGKTLLMRAVGPSLSAFGIEGALAGPKLEISQAGATGT
ncbi:MAG: hypothetical protein EXS37_10985, partial [Opitutus sp.]|nr:hypothetical protein [Opitutus sp.]